LSLNEQDRRRLSLPMSAWLCLSDKYKSADVGFSVAGDFYCPHEGCDLRIGRNLKNERPFKLVAQHLLTHKKEA